MNYTIAIAYSICTLIGLSWLNKYRCGNPVFWFLIFQWQMGVGVILLMEVSRDSDLFFVLAYFLATIFYLVGALSYLRVNPITADFSRFFQRDLEIDGKQNLLKVKLIFVISLLVTALYYNAVGTNLFLNIVLGVAVEDFSTSRLAAYSSGEYFAPGYTNQFKNVLLPLTASILALTYYYSNERLKFRALISFIVVVLPIALLGTGQRAFIAFASAAFLFGFVFVRRLRTFELVLPGVLVLSLFGVLTSLYKRHQLDSDEILIFAVFKKIFERFFYTEQQESLQTFRHLFERDIVFFKEWYEQLRGILPGNSGSYLQHEMFELMHGTDRGTAAVSTVASLVYNGGIFAVVIFYFFFGFFCFALYHRFLKGRRSVTRVMSYGVLFFYLAIFVSGGPSTFLNRGGFTVLIFMLIRKLKILSKMRNY